MAQSTYRPTLAEAGQNLGFPGCACVHHLPGMMCLDADRGVLGSGGLHDHPVNLSMPVHVMLDITPSAAAATAVLITAQTDVTGGIITFAVGILVGLISVVITDKLVRRRMRTDYDAWVQAGRPERRRRGRVSPG